MTKLPQKDLKAMQRFKDLVEEYTIMLRDIANLQFKIFDKAMPYLQERNLDRYKIVEKYAKIANTNRAILNKLLKNEDIQLLMKEFDGVIKDIKTKGE